MTTMEREDAKTVQRMSALEKANHIRVARRELKERIRDREITVGEVLGDPPEWALTMKVADILSAQRGWGETKTRQRMGQVHVPASAKVGDLSASRRGQLIAAAEGAPAPVGGVLPERRVVVELRPKDGRSLTLVEQHVLRAVTELPSTSEHVAMRIAGRCGSSPSELVEILAALESRGLIRSCAAFGGRRGYYQVRGQAACAA